jgi:hypothetical protein
MEPIRYQQLANFLRQRGQKIPGVPFLSLWQFGGAVGFGLAGYVLALPTWVVLALAFLALFAFYVYHGEFAGRRLLAMATVAALALVERPRCITFEPAWADLAATPSFAGASLPTTTIRLAGEDGQVVLS